MTAANRQTFRTADLKEHTTTARLWQEKLEGILIPAESNGLFGGLHAFALSPHMRLAQVPRIRFAACYSIPPRLSQDKSQDFFSRLKPKITLDFRRNYALNVRQRENPPCGGPCLTYP
jgi:hypothetical protein